MTDALTPEILTRALDALRDDIRQEFAAIRPRVDGVPLIWQAIEAMRHDIRNLRAAINDMARVNITAGEVEALHADIDRMQTRQMELEARIAALEGREP